MNLQKINPISGNFDLVSDPNSLPIFLFETSTIADFKTGRTHYYVGETPITYDYNLQPYPAPTPVNNFNFVNLSVHTVQFLSNGGNNDVALLQYQTLVDIVFVDNGTAWELTATLFNDNIYNLQQTTDKGATTTNAMLVRNNPDTYRTRYSIIGQEVQRDDLGFRISYHDTRILKLQNVGGQNFAINFPDISGNAPASATQVDFRPNVSGTVAYLSDLAALPVGNLQQVTDAGNTTTNSMMITDGVNYELTLSPSIIASNLATGSSFSISPDKVEIINLSGVTSISQGNIFFDNTGGNQLNVNAGSITGIKNHVLPNGDGTYALKLVVGVTEYNADAEGIITVPAPITPKRVQTVEWINGNYAFTANQWSTQNITTSSFLYGPTNLLVGTGAEPPPASVAAVTGSHILVPFGNSYLKRVRFSCGLPQIVQNRSFDLRIYGSRMNPAGNGRIDVQLLAFGNNLADGTTFGIFMYDLTINPQTPLTDDTYITMFIRDKLNNNHRGITINFEFEEV